MSSGAAGGLAPHFVPPVSVALASHADAYVGALTAYRYDGEAASVAATEGTGAWLDRFVADTTRACGDASLVGAHLVALYVARDAGDADRCFGRPLSGVATGRSRFPSWWPGSLVSSAP